MKNNYCHISIVLDRSGSMSSIAADTIGGLNTFISDQKKIDGEATLSLMEFDQEFNSVFNFKNINDVNLTEDYRFIPRGMTALYDAIGKSISQTGKYLSNLDEDSRPDKVIFVIVTDGAENSSHEYSHYMIQDIIKHQTDVYSWEFIFLGANIDAVSTASYLGISSGNSITYAANSKGVCDVYSSVSANLTAFRSASSRHDGPSSFFTDEDRAKQVNAGA